VRFPKWLHGWWQWVRLRRVIPENVRHQKSSITNASNYLHSNQIPILSTKLAKQYDPARNPPDITDHYHLISWS
jgi:hypothetical protein